MKRAIPTETAIASAAADWLQACGWEVYEEVQIKYGPRPDLVGVAGAARCVVECKRQMSMDVIWQAYRAMQIYVRLAWVCVPYLEHSSGSGSDAGRRICVSLGVGVLIAVHDESGAVQCIRELERPRSEGGNAARRRLAFPLPDACNCAVATHKAGQRAGGQWTPYRQTCMNIERVVRETPGITLSDLLKRIEHHYHSEGGARSTIPARIRLGQMPGVEIRTEGRKLRLYPAGMSEVGV